MTGLKERLRGNSSHWADVMRQAADEIERLEARVKELEGALLPFVELAEHGDTEHINIWKAACAALSKSSGETP